MSARRWMGLAAVIGCLLTLTATPAAGRAARSRGFGSPHTLLRGVHGYAIADATGGALWVAVPASSGQAVLHEVDAATGGAGPQLSLGRVNVGDVLYAAGWLWVTTAPRSGRGPGLLWRIEPDTLTVLSQTRVRGGVGVPSVTSAGGSLWVGAGGEIEQVASIGGTVIGRVRIRTRRDVEVGTGPGGRSLLVSEGSLGGLAHIERRDGVTGRLLATSGRFLGVTEPALGGTFADRLWFSEATGMAGYFGQLNVRTLKPRRTYALGTGAEMASNGIRAQVIDGILWVTQPGGGAAWNYCANPLSGRPRLVLPGPERRGAFVTADAHRLYYLAGPYDRTLMSATIPSGCR